MRAVIFGCLMGLMGANVVLAADIPLASPNDPRVRVVKYKPNEVVQVMVKRGVVTRITLEPDEKIEVSVVGLSSRCDADGDEWCISAAVGANQIFIRPRDAAKSNNMELHTSKRDYSFEFEVIPDKSASVMRSKSGYGMMTVPPFFRVVFDYARPLPVTSSSAVGVSPERNLALDQVMRGLSSTAVSGGVRDPNAAADAADRLKAEAIYVRNSSYSKQVLPGGADAEPTMVFDDGRFTYFEFLGAREIPAIFSYGSDGEPSRVNWHMQGSFVVVQRTARKFTLRLGGAVVGIFNENFDTVGIDTPSSTVSTDVVREDKGVKR